MIKSLPFSATVLLRPSPVSNLAEDPTLTPHVLEVFNPLAVKTLSRDDGDLTPLAADSLTVDGGWRLPQLLALVAVGASGWLLGRMAGQQRTSSLQAGAGSGQENG